MHYFGWVFGDDVHAHMTSLTHPMGYPRGEVQIPIDMTSDSAVELPMSRSGWVQVTPDPDWPMFGPDEDDFIIVSWPKAAISAALGPYAILGPHEIVSAGVQARYLDKMGDRRWYVHVPRYFETVGDHWSYLGDDEWRAFITKDGEKTSFTCVADLDVEASLDQFKPSLIVGPDGPMYFDAFDDDPLPAALSLTNLPGDTPAQGVDFHR